MDEFEKRRKVPGAFDFGYLFPVYGLKCVTCGFVEERYRNEHGELVKTPHPPEGYYFHGTGRLSFDQKMTIYNLWLDEMRDQNTPKKGMAQ